MAALARALHVLLLGLWVGAGVTFLGVLGPDAFGVLSSRQAARDLLTTVLAHLDLGFLLMSPVVALTLFVGWIPLGVSLRLRAVGILVLPVLAAVSRHWITPTMEELRQSMGATLDDIGSSDPLLMQFANLDVASSAVMIVHVALAALLLVSAVVATTPKQRHGIQL